jgi:DNA repair ATPase RecN
VAERDPLGALAGLASGAAREAGRVAEGLWRAPDLPRLLVQTLSSIDERLDGILEMTEKTAETTPPQLEAIRALHPELVRNRDAAEDLGPRLDALRSEMSDIQLLRPVLEEMQALRSDMGDIELLRPVLEEMQALRSDMGDIQLLQPVLEELRALRSELREIRQVVEPLAPAAETVGRVADRLPGSRR